MQSLNCETPSEDIVNDENCVLNKLLALKISKSPGPLFHPRLLKEVVYEVA